MLLVVVVVFCLCILWRRNHPGSSRWLPARFPNGPHHQVVCIPMHGHHNYGVIVMVQLSATSTSGLRIVSRRSVASCTNVSARVCSRTRTLGTVSANSGRVQRRLGSGEGGMVEERAYLPRLVDNGDGRGSGGVSQDNNALHCVAAAFEAVASARHGHHLVVRKVQLTQRELALRPANEQQHPKDNAKERRKETRMITSCRTHSKLKVLPSSRYSWPVACCCESRATMSVYGSAAIRSEHRRGRNCRGKMRPPRWNTGILSCSHGASGQVRVTHCTAQ